MSYHVRTYEARLRRATVAHWFRGAAILGLLAAFCFVWWVGFATLAGAAELNHPDCDKTEQALQGPRWYADQDYRLVVLKSSTTSDVFYNVLAGDPVSTVSGKDISHVIRCGGPTPTTTTEAPPTTTVQPPTTTVPTPPSTTVTVPSTTTVPEVPTEPICHEDEDCWDCETMGNRICGVPVTPARPAVPVPSTPQLAG